LSFNIFAFHIATIIWEVSFLSVLKCTQLVAEYNGSLEIQQMSINVYMGQQPIKYLSGNESVITGRLGLKQVL